MADKKEMFDETYKPPRTERGTFLKGVSYNPGGKPKRVKEVNELARDKSMEAMKLIHRIMNDEEQKTGDRLAAARIILQAGGVMIKESRVEIDQKKNDPLAEITAEELKRFLAIDPSEPLA